MSHQPLKGPCLLVRTPLVTNDNTDLNRREIYGRHLRFRVTVCRTKVQDRRIERPGPWTGTPQDFTSPFSASFLSSLSRVMKSGCQSCPCLPHSLEGPAAACFWLVKSKQQAKYWERSLLGEHESYVNPIQFPVTGAQGNRKAVSWFMFSLSLGDQVSPVIVLRERMLHSCTT